MESTAATVEITNVPINSRLRRVSGVLMLFNAAYKSFSRHRWSQRRCRDRWCWLRAPEQCFRSTAFRHHSRTNHSRDQQCGSNEFSYDPSWKRVHTFLRSADRAMLTLEV